MAWAVPPLTVVQDVLYKADGTRFDGVAEITWKSFQAADGSQIPQNVVTVRVQNGYLRVALVPTTNALTTVCYTVRLNSSGRTQFTEQWAVPPSVAAVGLNAIRTQPGPGAVMEPGASVTISDVIGLRTELDLRPPRGTGYTAGRAAVINALGGVDAAIGLPHDCIRVDGTSGPCGGEETEVEIGDVTGLWSELDKRPEAGASFTTGRTAVIDTQGRLNGATGLPADCVRVDGTSGPCGGAGGLVFVDGEAPAGVIDGVNTAFTLSAAPTPAASLTLFRNGMLLRQGADYTVSENTVLMATGRAPAMGDRLDAWYRLPPAATLSMAFADAETPTGSVDGVNSVFGLAATPMPASSLRVYRNGLLQKAGVDYNLSVNTITFMAVSIPTAGDILQVWYRY
jgi:hypothetical protein